MKKSKGKYPFRIGCTSYVKPDDIIPNVEYMGPFVDDIELVLFESPEISNLPSKGDVKLLCELAEMHDISYSVHFPTTHKACGTDTVAFMDDLSKVVEFAAPLQPFAWILHFEGLPKDPTRKNLAVWEKSCDRVLSGLAGQIDDMSLVAVENLSYPWTRHEKLAVRYGASLCIDVGHLWGNSPETWEDEVLGMLPSTRVVHLHGLRDGRDHVSLKKTEDAALRSFVDHLRTAAYAGLVTLEVFSEPDTAESLEVMDKLWL